MHFLGGLGLTDPSAVAVESSASESVTSALTNQILLQRNNFDVNEQSQAKVDTIALQRQWRASWPLS